MRPAGRRKIMKVALRVKKVGQHCFNRSAAVAGNSAT